MDVQSYDAGKIRDEKREGQQKWGKTQIKYRKEGLSGMGM